MKLAYLLPDPGIPVGGTKGASVHVGEVCRALARRGVHVRLYGQRVLGAPPEGIDVVHLDPGPVPKGEGADLGRARAAAHFRAVTPPLVRAFAPDVVYERLCLMYDGAGPLARELGAARVVEVNAPIVEEWSRQRVLSIDTAAREAERAALLDAQVVAVSAPLARWAMTRGAREATVITNGVDVHRFAPPGAAPCVVRERLGLVDSELVGFVGSLKPWHGVDVLLEAVAHLAATRPRLRLLVVGDGPARSALQTRAEQHPLRGRVHFTGAVAAREVPAYVQAFDVACAPFLPSHGAYFSPLKVAEAMACARPVVASDVGPIRDMTAGAARLVEPGSPHALAQALDALLDDPRARADLGRRARDRATTSLSWDGVVDQLLDVLARAGPAPARLTVGHR